MASKVFLWGANGSGGVLMAISVVVLANQFVVMKLQNLKDGRPCGQALNDSLVLMMRQSRKINIDVGNLS